ncbi:MAG: SCO family protein [Rhodocyclaceae bacterium]|nr:SCO family protein [Rhodocyclaceae bacterium]
MYNLIIKIAIASFVVLMGAVFFWQPIKMTFSNVRVTNDFVLQTTTGTLDSKALRGKVLLVLFGYASCGEPCAARLARLGGGLDQLSAREREQVKVIVVSVDTERDTPARIADYAKKAHPEFIGATGKADEVKALTEAFGADNQKFSPKDGSTVVEVSQFTYLVAPDGRFVSVLNEATAPEKVAAALRARIPGLLPPGN